MGKYKSWGVGLFICLLCIVAFTIYGVFWWVPTAPEDDYERTIRVNNILEKRQAMKREWEELCIHISKMF